jgi:hypothetical protein
MLRLSIDTHLITSHIALTKSSNRIALGHVVDRFGIERIHTQAGFGELDRVFIPGGHRAINQIVPLDLPGCRRRIG